MNLEPLIFCEVDMMKKLVLKYCTHIAVFTGKLIETVETKAKTIRELIAELDEKYPGFKELFFINGKFNVRTMIYLKKKRAFTLPVIDTISSLKDFDEVIFI
jgi:molybdopterin converting factor small subunit